MTSSATRTPDPAEPDKRWKRALRHVTRQRARVAAMVVLATIAAYLLVGLAASGTSAWRDPTQQLLLIIAGTAASAVFLPELSANLWTLRSTDVRELVPTDKRRDLAKALIGAETLPGENFWGDLVYERALVPLIAASRDPSQILYNMSYSVQAHLNEHFDISGRDIPHHAIQTESRSERLLPAVSEGEAYWISAARTETALRQEFLLPNCIAREHITLTDGLGEQLSPTEWRRAVEELCTVSVIVNGEVQDVRLEVRSPRPDDEVDSPRSGSMPARMPTVPAGEDYNEDIVRWRFSPAEPDRTRRVPVHISFDFPIASTEDRFLVYFKYYCAGATSVSMKVFNLAAELRCDPFFARGKGTASAREEDHTSGLLATHHSYSTGRDSLLWPGSGALFSWHDCPADRISES